ncbi:TerB N-terminal domain-containing protein [Duganella sp. P38]|uniref:tellurite resistance TerB family protein n=1 Tax=Duganella sp. P38 TaxID=3423949 RepID=UPI003D7B0622
MAKRNSGWSATRVSGAVVLGFILLCVVPLPVTIILGVAGLLIWGLNSKSKSKLNTSSTAGSAQKPQRSHPANSTQTATGRASRVSERKLSSLDVPITVTVQFSSSSSSSTYRIPDAPPEYGEAKWIPEGESVTVAGTVLPGGLFYVGTKLLTNGRQNDPCLIDPSKQVATRGNFSERQMGYWPHYGAISPEARRSYLNWLAAGRKDSDADIGFVFLFFYGLERRVLVDTAKEPALRAEWPVIQRELDRLIEIYGGRSGSFRQYATSLLSWLGQVTFNEKAYRKPLPKFERTGEIPFALKFALGQAALDKAPIPSHLALAWIRLHPMSSLKTAAYRCADEFDNLFAIVYERTFGEGMVITKNRTKLKLTHAPASSAFSGQTQIANVGDIPDISVLTAPFKKLQDLVQVVAKELDAYSRYVGKNPDTRNSLEGLLLLPVDLWPASTKSHLQDLKEKIGYDMLMMSFREVLSSLRAQGPLTKEKGLALARALESKNIGIEPDVLGGAKLPKDEENVVLFAVSPEDASIRSTPTYKAALLTLQLASSVASADGDFCEEELEYLQAQVRTWKHLTPSHTHRLQAHLLLLKTTPVSLTALRSKLDGVDAQAKDSIAAFIATVAQVDGTVSPEEVKLLEKLYKALGVDSKRVFSDVHAAASGRQLVASTGNTEQSGFKLDAARIAALQKDTESVTALLSNIFKEEEVVTEAEEADEEIVPPKDTLLGLDDSHTVLARLLMSRSQWSRDELGDAAADLELMLDGALETINEAAFESHDVPFIEGDDPITVNPEFLEKLAA